MEKLPLNFTELSKETRWFKQLVTLIAVSLLTFSWTHTVIAQETQQATSVENNSSPDVYYGRPANKEEAAFSVWISAKGGRGGSGTILSDRVIITARHILTPDTNSYDMFDASDVFVHLGGDQEEPAFRVKEIKTIGTPSAGNNNNDKVLLILDRSIDFSDSVKPIPLGERYMANSQQIFAIGHGRNEEGFFAAHPNVAEQLMDYEHPECKVNNFDVFVTKPNPENPQVIHKGDSGGALFAYIPEDTEEYAAGYYYLGALSQFCGERDYDKNGLPIPNYGAIFKSIFFEDAHLEIQKIINDAEELPDEYFSFLPSIGNNPTYVIRLPVLKKKS